MTELSIELIYVRFILSLRPAFVEQLNLQIAAVDVVVASFVTYEPLPSAPAQARIRKAGETAWKTVEGVTHSYTTTDKTRTYIMHYVPLRDLVERTKYEYQVKSGSAACGESILCIQQQSLLRVVLNLVGFAGPFAEKNTRLFF
jgi:hypothetical protein